MSSAYDDVTKSLAEHQLNQWYFQRFKEDNPILAPKVIAYINDLGPRPTDSELADNHYAIALVGDRDAQIKLKPVVPPPPPPVGAKRGVSYVKLGNSDLPPTHIADYDTVQVGMPGTRRAALYSAKLPCVYMSAVSCTNTQPGQDHNGVQLWEARELNCLLKTSSGAEVFTSYGHGMADPAHVGYQQAWCKNVEKIIVEKGLKGIAYIDDTIRHWNGLATSNPVKYPNDDGLLCRKWEEAQRQMCEAVYDYFQPKGIYVCWNAGAYVGGYSPYNDGTSTLEWFTMLAPHADALMCERWEELAHLSPPRPRRHNEGWDGWLRVHPFCNSKGVDFIPMVYDKDAGDRDYLLASFLLDWDGQGSFVWHPGTPDPWNAKFDKMPMKPTGAKRKNGNRWERDTDKGLVWVDPVAGTASLP